MTRVTRLPVKDVCMRARTRVYTGIIERRVTRVIAYAITFSFSPK